VTNELTRYLCSRAAAKWSFFTSPLAVLGMALSLSGPFIRQLSGNPTPKVSLRLVAATSDADYHHVEVEERLTSWWQRSAHRAPGGSSVIRFRMASRGEVL
jgi:hypothetical protein